MKTYRCGCGAWTGERCQWTGPLAELVIVEFMPECWRESHRAAGNAGRYPHNGSVRVAAEVSCARLQVDDDPEWSRIVRPAREADALDQVEDEPADPESASRCDRCGEIVADIDAGFSPGLHEMAHDCGGTWRRGWWTRATGDWQPLRVPPPRHQYGHDPDSGF